MAKFKLTNDKNLIYQLDGTPSLRIALPIGIQHILSMFTGNLAPILIVANAAQLEPHERILMMQCAMFASAIGTFIQLYPLKLGRFQLGSGLPIVMGTAFAFVPIMTTIASEYGIAGVLGATILGSVIEVFMAIFYLPLKRFFSPLLIGSVLVSIGISLLSTGATYFAGGAGAKENFASPTNLILGFATFGIIMLLQRFGKGMWKATSILIGIVCGYVLAVIMGQVNFDAVGTSSWLSVPIPFTIKPEFHLSAIISFMAVYVVSGLETMGNTSGITIGALNREATAKETSGAIMADALSSCFAGIFNTLPSTAYGQNAGLVSMTKIVNRFCIACGAAVLLVAGLVPKVGAIFNSMPPSVLGGAVITVFAMITINGIKLISKAGFSDKNILVLGIIFGIGYGLSVATYTYSPGPDLPNITVHIMENVPVLKYIFHDTVTAVCVVGILADLILGEKKGKAVEKQTA